MASHGTIVVKKSESEAGLSAEAVQGAALSLEGIDDVEGGDGLSLRVLGVGDCVSDDAFEEGLEDTASFFVDHCLELAFYSRRVLLMMVLMRRGRLTGRDTLDTATARETTDGGLGYALDVVTENLSVTLGSAFAEALSTFSACVDALAMLMLE